eukprot:GILJ01022358.1.p1 GENE.GILJ01022358.1~~GILJ01022358.1.p1  ORF type:complete len:381 (-),score=28.44 GILJ01022358.1:303-1445(-)
MALAFFATLGAKLDNINTTAWSVALIPGYTLLACSLLCVTISIIFRIKKYRRLHREQYVDLETAAVKDDVAQTTSGGHTVKPTKGHILKSLSAPEMLREAQFWAGHFLIVSVAISLFLLGLSYALDGGGNAATGGRRISWWFVYTPAIVGNVLSVVSVPVLRSTLRLRGVHDISTYLLVFLNVINVSLAALRISQLVLVICAIEGKLQMYSAEAWTVPAELYFTLMFVSETTVTVQRTRALRKMEKEAAYMSSEESDETAGRNRGKSRAMWAEVGFWFYVNVLVVFGLIFSARADAVGGYTRAYIPFFILFGSLFLGCLFMFTCFTIFIEAEAIEKREREKEEVVELERQRTDEQRENGDNYDAVVNCYDDRPYTPTATS